MPWGRYLIEGVKDAVWELGAEGGSEAEIGRRLGLPKRTVSGRWDSPVAPGGRAGPRCSALDAVVDVGDTVLVLEDPGAL